MTDDLSRWQQPVHGSKTRKQILQQRHQIARSVRAYFDAQDFIEIDAPLLVHGTTPDIAVESFAVGDKYLVTSTEYQMKRLAAGGFEKIYSLTKNFRMGDAGTYRNPEFTMLEWGRVNQTMREIERDAENFVTAAARALGISDKITYQGKEINLRTTWKRMSVADAIHAATGYKIETFDAPSCAAAAHAAGIDVRDEWLPHGDFLFSLVMDHIQPAFGTDAPVFITEFPLYQTTSAAVDENDPTRAARSELFIAGVELSDGFAGLADANLQEQFFAFMAARRAENGQPAVQVDERYLKAMRSTNICGAGMAMGFDRLVMLLTDQPSIQSVLAFNWDEV